MKKLFLLFTMLISTMTFMFADDETQRISLTLNIDNAANVVVLFNGEEETSLKDGVNKLEINPWSNMEIRAAEGCTLVSVTEGDGQQLTITDNSASKFIGDTPTEISFTIVTSKASKVNFTIDVDNIEKAKVIDVKYNPIKLEQGENELELDPSLFPLRISAQKYGDALYGVTMDGEPLEDYYGGYEVTPTEGCVIKIIADFPDVDYNVSFKLPEGVANFFTRVDVNGEAYTDFMNGMEVKCGSKVALYFNPDCWKNSEEDEEERYAVQINGKDTAWFGPGFSFIVKDDTTVEVIKAVPADMITVTIDIDVPRNVTVYRTREYYDDIMDLKEGENTVELPKENATIVIVVQDEDDEAGCAIEGVTVNGKPKNVEYSNYLELKDLEEGDIIKIFTKGYSTGVESIAIDDTTDKAASTIYTLDGKRVRDMKALPKGIYIVDGKKVMIR